MRFTTFTDYIGFYTQIESFANSYASRLFSDISLRTDAVDRAMDKVVDWLLTKPQVDNEEAFAKTIVKNSLRNSSRRRKIEATGSGDNRIIQVVIRKMGRPPK